MFDNNQRIESDNLKNFLKEQYTAIDSAIVFGNTKSQKSLLESL